MSRYMRVGNTLTVRQVCTLASAPGGTAFIDIPFPTNTALYSSIAPVGTIKAIRNGIG
jgi:hypothetical protein